MVLSTRSSALAAAACMFLGLFVGGCGKQGAQKDTAPATTTPAERDTPNTPNTPSLGPDGVLPPAKGAMPPTTSVLFLHHSTGENVWKGGVPQAIAAHNARAGTSYRISALAFPHEPYPWDNYPYDYWNIWVKNAGPSPFQGQETLEMLTRDHQVIVFKHCYPMSAIEEDSGPGDVTSSQKTLANYKLQYEALKSKLRTFPSTRFIVWTGAALTRKAMSEKYGGNDQTADRARQFFTWVKGQWDEPGDNIFVFDFFHLQTEGGSYLLDRHAQDPWDSHPNAAFASRAAPAFAKRVIDVIEGRGDFDR